MKDKISNRVKNMNVSGVRKMFEMASKMENPIDLSLGLPDFDVQEEIKKEAINAIKQGKNKYTPTTGINKLKEKISKKLNEKNNISLSPEQVIVTSSGSGALSIILTTLVNPNEEVMVFDPYFVAYKQLIYQCEGKPVFVKTNEDFSPDLEDMKEKITDKTKALIINSPNNPTGKVYNKETLQEIADISRKNDIIVISDEVYEEFCYEKNHFSIGSIYENTITVNAFSKSNSMTGWRVGYCAGPKEIIQQAAKVQQFNFVCAPAPFQEAAVKAIDVDIKENVKEYKERRDLIYEGLKNEYEIVKPEGAFYAFIKYPYNPEEFIEDCIKENLLVVPGKIFSEENDYFRISFATGKEQLKKAIKTLKEIINKKK